MFRKQELIQLGDCKFDPVSHALWRDNQRVEPVLTASEAKLLTYLYSNSERIINRKELLKHVASKRVVDDAIITQYIKTLRKALGDTAKNPRYIRTYQKEGYQFIAPVKRLSSSGGIYLVTASVILTVAIAFVVLTLLQPSTTQNNYAPPIPMTSLKGHELFGTTSPDAKYLLFSHQAFEDQRTWQLVLKSREFERYYQLTADAANHMHAKFSNSGNQILYHVFNASINEIRIAELNWQTYQLENIRTLLELPASSYTLYLAWKDENNFYFASKSDRLSPSTIKLFNIEQATEELITNPDSNGAGDLAIAYSPAERKLAFLRNIAFSKSEVYTYDEINQSLNLHYSLPIEPFGLGWTDTGQIIIRDKETRLSLLDIETNEVHPILKTRYPIYAPFFIDAKTLGFTQGDFIISDILQDSLYLNGEANPYITSSFNDYRPVIAAETEAIAFISNRTGNDQIWMREAIGSLRQVSNFTESIKIQHLAVSPDANLIAYTTNAVISIVDSYSGALVGEIRGDNKSFIDPVFSKDSKYLYFTFKHNDEWFIEKRPVSNLQLETILTKGFLVKPCHSEDCYYYLRLSDKTLMKRNGLGEEISTEVNLSAVGFASQFEIIGEEVYYTAKTDNKIKLYRHVIGEEEPIEITQTTSIYFSINPTNKRIYYATRRTNDTNIEGIKLQ